MIHTLETIDEKDPLKVSCSNCLVSYSSSHLVLSGQHENS